MKRVKDRDGVRVPFPCKIFVSNGIFHFYCKNDFRCVKISFEPHKTLSRERLDGGSPRTHHRPSTLCMVQWVCRPAFGPVCLSLGCFCSQVT